MPLPGEAPSPRDKARAERAAQHWAAKRQAKQARMEKLREDIRNIAEQQQAPPASQPAVPSSSGKAS